MFNRIPLTPFYPLTLLVIPFIGMQFTEQVKWSLFDFILMGVMLISLGFGIHLISLRTKTYKQKAFYISVSVFLFLFIWGELAIGIIGSLFAGD